MPKKEKKYDFIQQLIEEAEFYRNMGHIQQLAQTGQLSHAPLQPLAMALQDMNSQEVAKYLPLLSGEQREALLDLDLWHKDHLDVHAFSFWIDAYHKTSPWELKQEFIQSEQFALYLKGVMTISTFDHEDPHYPEHKNFFLTDDDLLLIEYNDSFPYVAELQDLLRIFYTEVGVEKAYTHLFKIVVDCFSIFQEEQYRFKKERLRDYGLVDYYDAQEMLAPMASASQLEHFMLSKRQATGKIDPLSRNQVLPGRALSAYRKELDSIHQEVAKVETRERVDFLHFNFLRLINATLSLVDALRKGPLSMTEVGTETRHYLLLGLAWLKSVRSFGESSVFDVFNFVDVYRIGKTLIHHQRSRLKKALVHHGLDFPGREEGEGFLGARFATIQEKLFEPLSSLSIRDRTGFDHLVEDVQQALGLLPFVSQFHQSYQKMRADGQLRDDYYLNYRVADIDFEAIILSSFINFDLGHYDSEGHHPKIGISIAELKTFANKYFDHEGKICPVEADEFQHSAQRFLSSFGSDGMAKMGHYLYCLLSDHLAGYKLSSMPDEEFRHVGGPIILKS